MTEPTSRAPLETGEDVITLLAKCRLNQATVFHTRPKDIENFSTSHGSVYVWDTASFEVWDTASFEKWTDLKSWRQEYRGTDFVTFREVIEERNQHGNSHGDLRQPESTHGHDKCQMTSLTKRVWRRRNFGDGSMGIVQYLNHAHASNASFGGTASHLEQQRPPTAAIAPFNPYICPSQWFPSVQNHVEVFDTASFVSADYPIEPATESKIDPQLSNQVAMDHVSTVNFAMQPRQDSVPGLLASYTHGNPEEATMSTLHRRYDSSAERFTERIYGDQPNGATLSSNSHLKCRKRARKSAQEIWRCFDHLDYDGMFSTQVKNSRDIYECRGCGKELPKEDSRNLRHFHLSAEHKFTRCEAVRNKKFKVWENFLWHLKTYHNFKAEMLTDSNALKHVFQVRACPKETSPHPHMLLDIDTEAVK